MSKGKDRKILHDFYFASPFFNPEQVEREERLKAKLRSLGYKVYSPKEEVFLDSTASLNKREKVFHANCKAIKRARAVFAITDGKDMGTIWEAGYAYGKKVPIIYFAETLGNNQFNLMLAQSGIKVYTNCMDITREEIERLLNGGYEAFTGVIE